MASKPPMQPPLPKLDARDKQIIYELEQNSRRSLGEIARRTRMSKQTLHYRIQRLVDNGIISEFITVLDVAKLGYINYEIWIQLNELSLKERKKLLDFLVKHENIRWVSSCGGKFDIAIAILAENLVQFNSIFKAILRRFPQQVKNYYVSISYELRSYPRTHLLKSEKRRSHAFLGGEPKRIRLDKADARILSLISKDSRISLLKLAKKAGITPNTVRAKMKRLEKEGVIQAYSILLQPSKMGLQNYELLVSLHNITEEKEKELESYCLLNDYVTFLLKVVGKWDVDVAFDAYDDGHFQQFLTEFRSRFAEMIRDFEFVRIIQVHKFDYFPMEMKL